MSSDFDSTPLPRWQRVCGMVMSGVVTAFLVLDGVIKLIPIQPVTDTMTALGYSGDPALARGLGIMTLVIALLYGLPRTAIFGAILMTGLLGGAIATHLRVGSPIFSHLLFGVYLGSLAWGGLYLRIPLLRKLIPLPATRR